MSKTDNFKGKGNTKGFKQHPENAHREGRPKKIYTILKELGFSGDDTKTGFKELSYYTKKELKEVIDDKTKPVIMQIIAKALSVALETGDLNKIKEVLDHTVGKAPQTINANINDKDKVAALFPDDLDSK